MNEIKYKTIEIIGNRIRLLDKYGLVIKYFTKEETQKFIEGGLYLLGYKKEE